MLDQNGRDMAILPHYSRYVGVNSVVHNGHKSFGLYLIPSTILNIPSSSLVSVEIVSGLEGRPDLISNKYYYTPYYDWVIIMYNRPINPIGWPKLGSTILIPTLEAVNNIIYDRYS